MESAQQLARRLREVYLDGTWIAGTNFKALTEDLTLEQATRRIGSLNSIAMLTFHLDYYLNGICGFLESGELTIRDKYSFAMSPIETADNWQALRKKVLLNADRLATHVEAMSDTDLEKPFFKEAYGNHRRNIEGVIEHTYYHLGQVSLIRKMVVEDN